MPSNGFSLKQSLANRPPVAPGAEFAHADLCDLSALPQKHFGLILAVGDPVGCASSLPSTLKQLLERAGFEVVEIIAAIRSKPLS